MDVRPITRMNVHYKLLARILAQRLRPLLIEHLQKPQFCGIPGNTILETVATVREASAQVGIIHSPMCKFSLDFQEAFDGIHHKYLFNIMQSYGLGK